MTEIVSQPLIIVCALAGAIGRAKLAQAQMLWSRRTIFDIAATGIVAMLLIPLGLDTKIIALMGLSGWLPPLSQLPLQAQAGLSLIGGYVFSSVLPKLIILANVWLGRWGMAIPLPESGVLTVEKPKLEAKTPEAIEAQGAAIVAKVERVVEHETAVAVAKAAVVTAETKEVAP